MKPEEFEKRVSDAISNETDKDSLDKLIQITREDIGDSDNKFTRYGYLLGLSILTYQLFAFGYIETISFVGGNLSDVDLFVKTFLIFPAGVYLILMATGYTRIYQKRLFEKLMEKRYPGFYANNLDMLLQKPNFMLSMDFLRREPGYGRWFWVFIATVPAAIFGYLKVFAPKLYIAIAFILAFEKYGANDVLLLVSASISGVFLVCGFMVFRKSSEVNGGV